MLGLLELATAFEYSNSAEPNEAWITAEFSAVLVLSPLLYAVLLRSVTSVKGAREWLSAIAFAVFAGLYWLSATFIFYGLTAGDRRDGPVEPTTFDRAIVFGFLLIAIAALALLMNGWRY